MRLKLGSYILSVQASNLKHVNHEESQTLRDVIHQSQFVPVGKMINYSASKMILILILFLQRDVFNFLPASVSHPNLCIFSIPPLLNASCAGHRYIITQYSVPGTNTVSPAMPIIPLHLRDIDPWQASTCNLEHLELQLAALIFMRL